MSGKKFNTTGICIPADEYFQTLGTLDRGLIMDISERLREQQVPKPLCEEWDIPVSGEFPLILRSI